MEIQKLHEIRADPIGVGQVVHLGHNRPSRDVCLTLSATQVLPSSLVHFYAEISGWAPRVSHMLVRWSRPSGDLLKLNTDGCSKENPSTSGGGGILRDGGGRLLLAFSCHFGQATSLQAEVRALLYGVKLFAHRGFGRLVVELDSLVLVHILLGKTGCPIYKEIQQLFALSPLGKPSC